MEEIAYCVIILNKSCKNNHTRITRASVCMCAVNETARLCHSLTEMQNMQDSYLNSVFAASFL